MPITLHWFRRDLRVRDNTALHAACAASDAVVGAFIIDPRWLGRPERMGPHQTRFWLESIGELQTALAQRDIPLIIRTSTDPVAALLDIAKQVGAETLTFNKDYEPAQISQDERLQTVAARIGLKIRGFKDAVIFEEEEILTGTGSVYSVFTPYKNAWLKRLRADPPTVRGLPRRPRRTLRVSSEQLPSPPAIALDTCPGEAAAAKQLARFIAQRLARYAIDRNIPAIPGTSRLSAHLSVGTISPRQILRELHGNSEFLTELIWRDFYRMIIFHYPHTVSKPFNDRYAGIRWTNNPKLLAAWQNGRTGYPLIDAAMVQLATTGFMHNRLRMLVAMFLTKDLDTHWMLGERHFMKTLVDYDQASNVGGWQWSASTGTDAAPYFRIMNPTLQSQRFDPDGRFIRQQIPVLGRVPAKFIHAPWTMPARLQRECGCIIGEDYPAPIVDHAEAKARAIAKFRLRPE